MRHRTTSLAAALLIVGVAANGCGVPDGGEPVTIERVPFGLDASTTTTSTSAPPPATVAAIESSTSTPATPPAPTAPPPTIATEPVTLYYVTTQQLVPVTVELARPASLTATIDALLDGPPPGETGARVRTALDEVTGVEVRDGGNGVATADLPVDFFDSIDTVDQRFAIGQIALALLARPGIGQVRFTERGSPLAVPTGSGGLSNRGQALSRRDYELLLEAPVPTTTTTLLTVPRIPQFGG